MSSRTERGSHSARVFCGVSRPLSSTAALLTGSAFRRPYFTQAVRPFILRSVRPWLAPRPLPPVQNARSHCEKSTEEEEEEVGAARLMFKIEFSEVRI